MFYKILTVFLISFYFSNFSFSSGEISDIYFQELKQEISSLKQKANFDPHDSNYHVRARNYEMNRARKALKISNSICPINALKAYKNFCPVDEFNPDNTSISQKRGLLFNDLVSTLCEEKTGYIIEKSTQIIDTVGRLCIVGFKRVELGKEILLSNGIEGVRTFYFALRDAKMPYKITAYLKDCLTISFRPEFTSLKLENILGTLSYCFLGDLYNLVKTDSSEAITLKEEIIACGLKNLFEEYQSHLGKFIDDNLEKLNSAKDDIEKEIEELDKKITLHEKNSNNYREKLNLLREKIIVHERLSETLHERKLLFFQQNKVEEAEKIEIEIESYKKEIIEISEELKTLESNIQDLNHELGPFLTDNKDRG